MQSYWSHYLGDLYAILTACSWSVALVFFKFSGQELEPIPLKVLQNMVAVGLFFLSIFILREPFWLDLSFVDWVRVIASAILGITLGDTLYISAIRRLELGFIAIIDGLYLPLVMVLAYLFLGEKVTVFLLLGACLVIISILLVHRDSFAWSIKKPWGSKNKLKIVHARQSSRIGVLYGVLSQLCMALCVVMIKDLLPKISLLSLTAFRFLIGTMALLLLYIFKGKARWALSGFKPTRAWRYTLPGAVLGPFMATLLWFAGFKYTLAGRAAVYNQMSVVFIVFLGAYFLKESLTRTKVLAIIFAISGGLIVFMN